MSIYYPHGIARMQILKVAHSDLPAAGTITLGNPVASRQGAFTAPIAIGAAKTEELGLQIGPASINGLVQTPRICYLDLQVSDEQVRWITSLESQLKDLLPAHPTVWFTRDMMTEDVEYFFDTAIRGNTLRAEIQRCEAFDTVDVQVFKQSGEHGDLSLIKKSGKVLGLVKAKGIVHKAGRLSIEWVLEQVLVKQDAGCKIGLGSESADDREQSTPSSSTNELVDEREDEKSNETNVPPSIAVEPNPVPPASIQSTHAEANTGTITEIDNIVPAGDSLYLRSERELVSDELAAVEQDERERRRAALHTFMEANGLDPAGYYFPDTDEDSDIDEGGEEEDVGGGDSAGTSELGKVNPEFAQSSAF